MCFNKTEDLNLTVFNMITGIYESKTLAMHIPCNFECKFDGIKCNSNQKWDRINLRKKFYLEPCYTYLWKW